MQVTQHDIDPLTLQFEIEIEPERVNRAFDRAAKQLSKKYRIPGFRPGQAPRQVVQQFLSEADIKEEAVRILVRDSLAAIFQERKIVPYERPDYEIESIEEDQPFVYKATVPLPPKIDLGDYRNLQAEVTPQTVLPDEMESALEDVRRQLTTFQKVEERGAQAEDRADITIRSMDDETHEPQRYMVIVGRSFGELDNALAGMKPGETKTVTVTFPTDFEDAALAGKMHVIEITMQELYEPSIPELDDELAKKIGFENTEALKAHVETTLLQEKQRLERQRLQNALIDKLREESNVQIPKTLFDRHAEEELNDFKEQIEKQGSTLIDYALQNGISEDTLIEELRKQSKVRLINSFILMEIAKKEKIEVKDSEINAEIETLGKEAGYKTVDIQRLQRDKDIRNKIRAQMRINRALEWLLGNALKQTAVEGSEKNENG